MGDLVDSHRDISGPVDNDIRCLQKGIPEKAVGRQIPILELLNLLFIGGNPFEPSKGRDHGEEKMKFRMFRDSGLDEDGALFGIETGCKEIQNDIMRRLPYRLGVGIPRGKGMPVGNKIVAVILVLEPDPVLESPPQDFRDGAFRWPAFRLRPDLSHQPSEWDKEYLEDELNEQLQRSDNDLCDTCYPEDNYNEDPIGLKSAELIRMPEGKKAYCDSSSVERGNGDEIEGCDKYIKDYAVLKHRLDRTDYPFAQ